MIQESKGFFTEKLIERLVMGNLGVDKPPQDFKARLSDHRTIHNLSQ